MLQNNSKAGPQDRNGTLNTIVNCSRVCVDVDCDELAGAPQSSRSFFSQGRTVVAVLCTLGGRTRTQEATTRQEEEVILSNLADNQVSILFCCSIDEEGVALIFNCF